MLEILKQETIDKFLYDFDPCGYRTGATASTKVIARCTECGNVVETDRRWVHNSRASAGCKACWKTNNRVVEMSASKVTSSPRTWQRHRKASAPSCNPILQDDIVISGSEMNTKCRCGCGATVSKFDPYCIFCGKFSGGEVACEECRDKMFPAKVMMGFNYSGMVVAA